jgi:hypothetical protein
VAPHLVDELAQAVRHSRVVLLHHRAVLPELGHLVVREVLLEVHGVGGDGPQDAVHGE